MVIYSFLRCAPKRFGVTVVGEKNMHQGEWATSGGEHTPSWQATARVCSGVAGNAENTPSKIFLASPLTTTIAGHDLPPPRSMITPRMSIRKGLRVG